MKLILSLIILISSMFPITAGSSWRDDNYDTMRKNLVSFISVTYKRSPDLADKLVSLAEKHSKLDAFPRSLDILAVMLVESKFNPKAINSSNLGLMQVNTRVHKLSKPFDPDVNIAKGAALLEEYYELAGKNETRTLVTYNAGPGGANRICGKKRQCETSYSRKVNSGRKALIKAMLEGIDT